MNRILVGVGGSPAGDAALLWALKEAAQDGSAVTAVMAWQAIPLMWEGPSLAAADPHPEQAAKERLDEAVKRVRESAGVDGVDVHMRVVNGPPALALERVAHDADLLVVGRRHDSSAVRIALGSVSSAALHHVPCPVVVVPGNWSAPERTGRVIVGVDGTAASRAALTWAAQRVVRGGGSLLPVLAVKPFDADVAQQGGGLRQLESAERARLEHLARQAAGDAAVDVQPQVLIGSAGHALPNLAQPADLLVVGSRGRGAIAGWLLGSTSAHLVHSAHVPVVVVREVAGSPSS